MKAKLSDFFYSCPETKGNHGMLKLTKRELFAAMALQGSLSNYDPFKSGIVNPGQINIIKSSVKLADLLIKELNKQE